MKVTAVLRESKHYVNSNGGLMDKENIARTKATASLVLSQAEDLLLTTLTKAELQEVARTVVFTKKLLNSIGGL